MDVNLNFKDHITDLCIKVNRKIYTLARVTPMGLSKRKSLMNGFFI